MIARSVDLYEYYKLERKGSRGGYLEVFAHSQSEELLMKIRPAMLIIPGGGYDFISDREGEPVALRFVSEGYNAFVLSYGTKETYPVPLAEACMAVAYIRENSERYGIDKTHIAAVGFSAGAHLAGLLATSSVAEVKDIFDGKPIFSVPDAVVLSYPVVTMKDGVTHDGTRRNITGGDKGLYEKLSVENRITKNSPPFFIWHTAEDNCVPAENSFMLAHACKNAGIPFALHIFEKGDHGLSLCNAETYDRPFEDPILNNVGKWVELALDWLASHGFGVKVVK